MFETHPDAISDDQPYFRILTSGCLDILVTLPVGVYSSIALVIQSKIIPFYPEWAITRLLRDTAVTLRSEVWKANSSTVAVLVFDQWETAFFAFVIFALFGLSKTSAEFYGGVF